MLRDRALSHRDFNEHQDGHGLWLLCRNPGGRLLFPYWRLLQWRVSQDISTVSPSTIASCTNRCIAFFVQGIRGRGEHPIKQEFRRSCILKLSVFFSVIGRSLIALVKQSPHALKLRVVWGLCRVDSFCMWSRRIVSLRYRKTLRPNPAAGKGAEILSP